MQEVVLVIHLFLALAIIGLVLLQRSEGGALGIGGGGAGRLTTAKGAANLLTRATAICAACFFATSLILAILAGYDSNSRRGLLDSLATAPAPVESPAEKAIDTDLPSTGTAVPPTGEVAVPAAETPSAPISE